MEKTISSIWFATPDIDADINRQMENTARSNLGIVITKTGDDWFKGTMPADERTSQPVGLVHGGANVLFPNIGQHSRQSVSG